MKILTIFRVILLIILPISFLIFTISSNLIIYNNCVSKVESITFPSPNGNIVSANLYYPKNPYSIPCPVILYLHGLSWSKDTDARFPLELAKKGFMVIQIDQEGHGHTNGGIYNRNTLGPYFWKNVIGALDYIYLRQDIFNVSAIGCFGHSLGGWATLMASVIDPRINASISLAGPSNLTYFTNSTRFIRQFHLMKIPFEEDILHNPELRWNHSAVHYINGTYPGIIPQNLLLIYGGADDLVPAAHGIDMNKTINDTSRCSLEILPGADHGLMNTDLFYLNIRVVQYFQEKLLGITPEPRSTLEKEIVWINVFVNQLISILLLMYLIAIFSFFTYKYITPPGKLDITKETIVPEDETKEKLKENKLKIFGKISLYLLLIILPVIGIWLILYPLLYFINNFIITMVIGGIMFISYSIIILWYKNRKKFSFTYVKQIIQRELGIRHIAIGLTFGILLTVMYIILSNTFKLIYLYPISEAYYLEALLLIIPILGIELIFRKLIQDELLKYNKSKRFLVNSLIRCVMGFIILIVLYPMTYLIQDYYIITTISVIFLTLVSLTSTYLYEKSKTVLTSVLFEVIFLAFVFANSYYLFF
ncbi:MAG: alpha/beta hydrolase family protein [Candidatus Helarchaeota archaeon]